MKIVEAFSIDEKGILIDKIVVDLETHEENLLVVLAPYDYRFHVAKWSSGEWIEGETQEEKEERESQELLESMRPTVEDLSDADLEIKMIMLLMEMEVI